MRHAKIALLAIACVLLPAMQTARAQVPGTAIVGFTNRSDISVVVKGYTIVNGVQRGGPILKMRKTGGKAFESHVPPGIRFYTIYDAANPTQVLLRDQPVPIGAPNVLLAVVPSLTNPNVLRIVADAP